MEYDEKKIRKSNTELEKKLLADRKEWGKKISIIVDMVKNISQLAECQVLMLSYRQIILDKIIDIKSIVYKRKGFWEKHFKNKWRYYSLNYDVKLSNAEKNQFIKADLSELKIQLNLLESHIDYYHECVRTLDNMAFAVRNRISLNNEE